MKTVNLTSVFNIPQIEDEQEEIDYRKLYEKEKKMRLFYESKTQQLEKQLKNTFKNNNHPHLKRQQKNLHHLMEQIKSFKTLLPNSVKIIPQIESNQSIDENSPLPLIHEWSIYGLTEQQVHSMKEVSKVHGSLLASNKDPSQIVQHSSRLVFPSGTSTRTITGKQALEISLDIINLSKQKMKSFILSFEPTSIQKKIEATANDPQLEVISMLNPERRIYAVCIELEQFSIVKQEDSMIELKTHRKTQQKSVKFQQLTSNKDTEGLQITVSKRVYCLFTYYPFFAFFQELLKSLLYAVKVERYIRYKQNGQNLKFVDSKPHSMLMKSAMEELRRQSMDKAIVVDKLLDFPVCGNNKAYLQLSRQALTYNLAEEWAYYVLSLFPLDTFLDLLTLLVLEEKIVFVCSNATILTHAIYLFTKVLIKPFDYPYPVVSLIPDQEEYLNAPFPVVYGYLKSPSQVKSSKLAKRYKNVYVCFQPNGVEIVSEEDKKKVLIKKSPKLRDRLISKFKKMHRNFPSMSFFNFMQKKNQQFEFPVNIELARSIISEVHHYINHDIYRLLPSDSEVEAIRDQLMASQSIEEEDINREVFLKIKEEYSSRSKDPFFAAFLQTQLLNVHIFKY